jgi:hypothetical protein
VVQGLPLLPKRVVSKGRRGAGRGESGHLSIDRIALRATLHCLTGCAIGEVAGLVFSTALDWHNVASIVLATVLAFVFGYSFTFVPLVTSGMAIRGAARVALAGDTVSITVMEIVDNAVVALVPGAMDAGLGDVLFWGSLALGLALAFAVALPVNTWLIARGRGPASHGAHHHTP